MPVVFPKDMAAAKDLMNEMKTVIAFLAAETEEAERLKETANKRPLKNNEIRRGEELLELCRKNRAWLKKAEEALAKFFRPAAA